MCGMAARVTTAAFMAAPRRLGKGSRTVAAWAARRVADWSAAFRMLGGSPLHADDAYRSGGAGGRGEAGGGRRSGRPAERSDALRRHLGGRDARPPRRADARVPAGRGEVAGGGRAVGRPRPRVAD